jgi:hypothetical protein
MLNLFLRLECWWLGVCYKHHEKKLIGPVSDNLICLSCNDWERDQRDKREAEKVNNLINRLHEKE